MPFPTDRKISKLSLPVRLSECDLMGIVHHASHIVYLEEARIPDAYYQSLRVTLNQLSD